MSQDIVQFFVFVALPIIVTASISIILIDYRRRMRAGQSAAYMERRDEYEEVYDILTHWSDSK
jgi:hypothetical protein